MKLNEEKWKAAYVKALADLQAVNPTIGASDGVVCAVASIRLIRDGLKADLPKGADEVHKHLGELIAQITAGDAPKLAGFASNASSAAAACKLKQSVSATIKALAD